MSRFSDKSFIKGFREGVAFGASRLREKSAGSVKGFSNSLSSRLNSVGDVSSRRRVVVVFFLAGLALILFNFFRMRSCSRQEEEIRDISSVVEKNVSSSLSDSLRMFD